MSADKRQKGRRRRSAPILLADGIGQPGDAPNERHDVGARRSAVRGVALGATQHAPAPSGHTSTDGDAASRVASANGAPTPAQRATELARAAHALAAHDQAPSTVGDSVTFAAREAPEIPVAAETFDATAGDATTGDATAAKALGASSAVAKGSSGGGGVDVVADVADAAWRERASDVTDDVTDDVTEEASVTLDQEQREGAVADQLAPNERPTLLGLPQMAGPLSGSSNPNPQNGPETTRRAARPPRPTRPVQPYDDAPAGNGAIGSTPTQSAPMSDAADAADDEDADEVEVAAGSDEAEVAANSDEAELATPAPPHDNARLQAMDLNEQAPGPSHADPPSVATPADPAQLSPYPIAAPQQPYGASPNPPNPPMPPVMPGAPLAPLGAQFGAPPPGYQTPYPAQAGGAPQPGQPGQPGQGDANAQLPTHAPWAVAASWGESSLSGPNTAAGMSYLFWWLSGIFVYFNERQNRFVRFHAMQSILLTGALTIISVALFTISQLFDDAAAAAHQPAIAHIGLGIVIIGYALGVLAPWFAAMVAAWSGTYLRIPFIGDYAERFAAPPREVYPDSPPY